MSIKSNLCPCMTIRYPVSIAINPGNIAKICNNLLVTGQIAKISASMQIGTVSIERNIPPRIPQDSGPIHNAWTGLGINIMMKKIGMRYFVE